MEPFFKFSVIVKAHRSSFMVCTKLSELSLSKLRCVVSSSSWLLKSQLEATSFAPGPSYPL
jgi:hypothetical protein